MPELLTDCDPAAVICLAFFLIGACIGSFLNVVVYRMPRGMSVNKPARSFCPHCGKPIPWYLNIPIFSWLMLRGRGACCGQPIAPRYVAVELVCALLFAATAWCFQGEELYVLLLLCLWLACMLVCFCTDWELMVVLPSLTVAATAAGLAVAWWAPWLLDAAAETPSEGLALSAAGALGGMLLFRLVGLFGKLCFGRRSRRFEGARPWSLRQEGDDLRLQLGDESLLWSELFMESSERLTLHAATEGAFSAEAAELVLTPEALLLPGGRRVPLESVESLGGTCAGYGMAREAMGSGDAWLAMAIGALCGWQGVLFSLVAGSFIGLAQAATARLLSRAGKTPRLLPFGPALITAAVVYLFYGVEIRAFAAAWYGF